MLGAVLPGHLRPWTRKGNALDVQLNLSFGTSTLPPLHVLLTSGAHPSLYEAIHRLDCGVGWLAEERAGVTLARLDEREVPPTACEAVRAQVSGQVVTLWPYYPSVGGEEHGRVEGAARRPHAGNARLRDVSDCPEPDARLLTAHVELAHVDEVPRRAQEGLASRIRNEN